MSLWSKQRLSLRYEKHEVEVGVKAAEVSRDASNSVNQDLIMTGTFCRARLIQTKLSMHCMETRIKRNWRIFHLQRKKTKRSEQAERKEYKYIFHFLNYFTVKKSVVLEIVCVFISLIVADTNMLNLYLIKVGLIFLFYFSLTKTQSTNKSWA
jgi:hypothetical protein